MSGRVDRNVAAHRRVADLFARRDQERVDDAEVDAALGEARCALTRHAKLERIRLIGSNYDRLVEG